MRPHWKVGLARLVCVWTVSVVAVVSAVGQAVSLPSGAAQAGQPAPRVPVRDFLFGNGTGGPYLLSWHHVLTGTEAISVGRSRLHYGLDYVLDTARGSVTFTAPLPQGQVAEVTYRCDPALAQPNAVPTRLPVELKLWHGRFSMSHGGGGQADGATALRAQLDQRLGGKTQATALVTRTESKDPRNTDAVNTTSLSLTTAPSRRAQLSGNVTHTHSERRGDDATTSLSLTTAPWERVKLESRFSQRVSEREGSSSALDLGWNARAGRRLMIDGGIARKEAEKAGAEDTRRLRLSLGAWSLEGTHRERSPLSDGGEREQQVRLDAPLMRGLRLGGAVGERVAGQSQAQTELREGFVEIAPTPVFRFRGDLKSSMTGAQEARVSSLSGALKLPRWLDVSGTYRVREATDRDALVTQDYVVALTPVRGVTLQGGYRENPEEPGGQVLEQLQRSVGVRSQVGSVGVSGTYTLIDAARAAADAAQTELKLTLDLAPKTRFFSGYRERATRDGSLLRDRTYSLGFTRSVGQSLFLLLEGEHTFSDRNGRSLADRTDTRATGSLGLRF